MAINATEGMKMTNKRLWTPEEDEFLREFRPASSLTELAEALGRSVNSVMHRCMRVGLQTRIQAKHTMAYDFFTTPNLENSYWAGFIAADGCIAKRENAVKIEIHKKDIDVLLAFRSATKCTAEIKEYRHNKVLLAVTGATQWKQDLARNFNITPAKSLTLEPPTHLDPDCTRAFIIGYIDGDGSICRGKDEIFRISVISTHTVLSWIKKHFEAIYQPRRGGSNIKRAKSGNYFTYAIACKAAREVYKVLKAHPVPYRLARKWQYEF